MGDNDDFLDIRFSLKENNYEQSNYFIDNKLNYIITSNGKKLY